jgi:hypothetical protein
LKELFKGAANIQATPRDFVFRYRSADHFMDVFRAYYGPIHKAFLALAPEKQDELHADLMALMARMNRATGGTLAVPSEYLEIVITKA